MDEMRERGTARYCSSAVRKRMLQLEYERNGVAHVLGTYTHRNGSWLNLAKREFSVVVRQCFDRRLPDIDTVKIECMDAASKSIDKAG